MPPNRQAAPSFAFTLPLTGLDAIARRAFVALAPSPFALAQSGIEKSVFSSPSETSLRVTLTWPSRFESQVNDLLAAAESGTLGLQTLHIVAVSRATDSIRLVACGSQSSLRALLQAAALHDIAAQKVVWS